MTHRKGGNKPKFATSYSFSLGLSGDQLKAKKALHFIYSHSLHHRKSRIRAKNRSFFFSSITAYFLPEAIILRAITTGCYGSDGKHKERIMVSGVETAMGTDELLKSSLALRSLTAERH